MRIGLYLASLPWPAEPEGCRSMLDDLLQAAEGADFHSIWTPDHFFNVPLFGGAGAPMPEAYTTLSWIAGRTRDVQLGTLVTAAPYRHPALMAKLATTLDVLSGGRAWLGVGAGWYEEETQALGLRFPSARDRLGELTEAVQIARQMFDGDSTPFRGTYFTLERPLNVPPPTGRIPILIGGEGERRTLRIVAENADACNFYDLYDLAGLERKLAVLRRHCEAVGRPYDDIVRTTVGLVSGDDVPLHVERLGRMAEAGVDLAILCAPNPADEKEYDMLAEVARQVRGEGRAEPPLLQNAARRREIVQ
ncbi:TIGR03560 family F420-dependent LLM class oxidoreductase [Nonomuraea sp. NPDC049637]|uniref:TIGR03560 family F420-dependent LLM class oxidoreductase n=1 Tax=Nonomuraea sp. NPDC049637 TaxID=3154356 RepID=UPI003414A4BD